MVSAASAALVSDAQAKRCGTVKGADGFKTAKITTKRIGCGSARKVLRKWLANRGQPYTGPRGYRCRYGSTGRWRCKRSRRIIRFTYIADEVGYHR